MEEQKKTISLSISDWDDEGYIKLHANIYVFNRISTLHIWKFEIVNNQKANKQLRYEMSLQLRKNIHWYR